MNTLHRLCQLRDLIRDCHAQELTLEDLSLETGLSPWHLLRAFRRSFGETPHAFLTRTRLARAKDLLTVTGRSVTEICLDVGFSSLGSFSTLFRREVGASPDQYRRAMRKWVTTPGFHPWVFVPFCFQHAYQPALASLSRHQPEA